MKPYDIAFIGHMCYDEVIPFQGETRIAPGSAVLCGAMAAARVGKKVLVITRLAQADESMLAAFHAEGIDTCLIPAPETTYVKVIHPSTDVDQRQIIVLRNSGPFHIAELPIFEADNVHLAGISDQEFSLKFMLGLKARGYNLSIDMQSFVRQVNPYTQEINFGDVSIKEEIVQLMEKVKLDVVEAEMLTGTRNLAQAAQIIESWGCPEVVITRADGVLARRDGKGWVCPFTNRNTIGRTGRGDTTFGAYLAWRQEHDVAESLQFASALVSIKMETPGPFAGKLGDVLARMSLTAPASAI